jgi:hypothetical protein
MNYTNEDFHPHMIYSVYDSETLASLPDKTTIIMSTSQSEMLCFIWSFLSVLLHSDPNFVEQIIVVINGPDFRNDDTSLQDKKQAFLEEIRARKWHNRDMPLTISRVWSRVGHAQAIEMAIPWVHTEFYTLIHDDVILTDPTWGERAKAGLDDPHAAMVVAPPLLNCGIVSQKLGDKWRLGLPHINTAFLTCKKAVLNSLGLRWIGYHIDKPFKLPEELLEYYKNYPRFGKFNSTFDIASTDIGAWIYYVLSCNNYKLRPLSDAATHLVAMSWSNNIQDLSEELWRVVKTNEKKIIGSEFGELYQRFRD